MKRILLAALLALFATSANAASCFWVGGSGTWSVTNIGGNSGPAAWASGAGGGSGTCAATGGVPKQSVDFATFDGNAAGLNGGTVTVDSSMNGVTISAITATTMVGTLDFSVNNPSMSFASGSTPLAFSGTGARTIKMGTGTFTITNNGTYDLTTTTGLNAASDFSHCTIVMTATTYATAQAFMGGGQSYGTLTFSGTRSGQMGLINGNNTFVNLNIVNPGVNFGVTTQTITGTLTATGTSTSYIALGDVTSGSGAATLNVTGATVALDRTVLRDLTFTGTAPSATNSIDLGGLTNVSVSYPTGGGGAALGHIIGG